LEKVIEEPMSQSLMEKDSKEVDKVKEGEKISDSNFI